MSKIEFYFSIGSRYSYLAYTQLKRLEDSYGCKFELKPLNSFRVISSRPDNPFANAIGTGQYDWSYREKDAHRWAKYYGVPFIEPRGRIKFDADMLAKACYAAKELGGIKAYSKELFHAMFVEPWINVIDLKECISRAEKCDLSISKFKNLIESDDLQKVFLAEHESCVKSGIFGVPTFVYNNEIFWGNDRIPLLEYELGENA